MLPVETVDLSCFAPHNPVSWLVCLYRVYRHESALPVVSFEDGRFFASDWTSIRKLWHKGFFGKGTLSRSEPSWLGRTKRRLGLATGKDHLSSEEVTQQRRQQREEFKRRRQELDKLEKEYKLADNLVGLSEVAALKNDLKNSRPGGPGSQTSEVAPLREEDTALVQNGELRNLETLQLSHAEALYLKLIQCVAMDVDLRTVWNACIGSDFQADDSRLLEFVVYAHYRSLGWCVRSGLKFASDMLLYQRGPPFQHAKYTVRVLSAKGRSDSWTHYSSLNRVIGGVKKSMVLTYVSNDVSNMDEIKQRMRESNSDFEFALAVRELLSHYYVDEIVYHRWVANRNRE